MNNNNMKPIRQPILRTGVLIPITDPVEITALERRCRQAEKTLAATRVNSNKPKPRKGK